MRALSVLGAFVRTLLYLAAFCLLVFALHGLVIERQTWSAQNEGCGTDAGCARLR